MRVPPKSNSDIDYLVRRRYPMAKAIRMPPSFGTRSTISPEERARLKAEIDDYEKELLALSRAQLHELAEGEREKDAALRKAIAEREENERFYNAPHSAADFEHWSKATYWTLEEAIALSFGKSPALVNWSSIEEFAYKSPFVAKYAKVRDLATRAKHWKQLHDPGYAKAFIIWAKRNDIAFPEELAKLVEKYGENIGDWKTAYEDLKSTHEKLGQMFDKLNETAKKTSATLAEQIDHLMEENKNLLSKIDELEKTDKPLNPKERDSLLKLVIGMAVGGYGYDPLKARNPTAGEVAGDLHRLGLPIDDDTVRKWLREAKEVLPSGFDS